MKCLEKWHSQEPLEKLGKLRMFSLEENITGTFRWCSKLFGSFDSKFGIGDCHQRESFNVMAETWEKITFFYELHCFIWNLKGIQLKSSTVKQIGKICYRHRQLNALSCTVGFSAWHLSLLTFPFSLSLDRNSPSVSSAASSDSGNTDDITDELERDGEGDSSVSWWMIQVKWTQSACTHNNHLLTLFLVGCKGLCSYTYSQALSIGAVHLYSCTEYHRTELEKQWQLPTWCRNPPW